MSVILKNWKVVENKPDFFTPPEYRKQFLSGTVCGHPHRPDGESIRTSAIVDVKGRYVTTESGTLYELLEPDAEYAQWVFETRGYSIDPENPIKVKF